MEAKARGWPEHSIPWCPRGPRGPRGVHVRGLGPRRPLLLSDDDKAVALGLLGAVFVVLARSLGFLAFLVVARLREGRIKAAAVQGGRLILGRGSSIAAVVGALPWSTRWLLNSSPWVPFLFERSWRYG